MRQVFSSARVENAEAVAQLLRDAGIEARVTAGRGWRGSIRGNFSYRHAHDKDTHAAVWVVRSDDQAPARALLRGHGLIESTRRARDSFLPTASLHDKVREAGASDPQRRAARYKLLLLGGVGIAMALSFGALRQQGLLSTPAPAVTAAPAAALPDNVLELVLLAELGRDDAAGIACLSIDGADPAPATLARLRRATPALQPASQCLQDVGGIVHRPSGARAYLLALRSEPGTGGSVLLSLSRSDKPLQSTLTRHVATPGKNGWSLRQLPAYGH